MHTEQERRNGFSHISEHFSSQLAEAGSLFLVCHSFTLVSSDCSPCLFDADLPHYSNARPNVVSEFAPTSPVPPQSYGVFPRRRLFPCPRRPTPPRHPLP